MCCTERVAIDGCSLARGIGTRTHDGCQRLVGSHSDVTARKEAELNLLHGSLHDAPAVLPKRVVLGAPQPRPEAGSAEEREVGVSGRRRSTPPLEPPKPRTASAIDLYPDCRRVRRHRRDGGLGSTGSLRRLWSAWMPSTTACGIGGDNLYRRLWYRTLCPVLPARPSGRLTKDRPLVCNRLTTSASGAPIVRAIVDLARNTGLVVVAEGIET